MIEPTELREGLSSLLASRGLMQPDGRPLYAYRFAKTDVDRVGMLLRRCGPSVFRDRHGAALVVSHVAEWFRRERSGGHWDWIRPLRTLGFEYGPYAQVQYRDIEELVSLGLRTWRRPEPKGGERLLAIIREAGFPVASVREDPRISSWLKYAVLCAERGFSTRDAVGAEAWRVSDRLAQALVDPAIELCDKIVELRRSLPPPDARGDPVDYLDQNRIGWRDELPFDVECEDIRSMVEQIVRTRDDGAAALDVNRHLVRSEGGWQARASLSLSSRVDLRRFPPLMVAAIREGRRLRVFPRPPYCDELVAVAAIETFDQAEGPTHELRAFVGRFDAPLALECEARLLVQSGSSTIGEFIATGGEALDEPVVALEVDQLDDEAMPTKLRVLGSSPVQTSRDVLALAIRDDHFDTVSFSAGFTDLGRCLDSDHRVVCFSGAATFMLDGARWSWRTTADRTVDARPVLVGDLLRNVREPVFRGVPHLWIERDGLLVAPKRIQLHWRPRGRGTWRPVDGSSPWGHVDLAVIERGGIRVAIGAAIVPPSFEAVADRRRRELHISGLETRALAAVRGVGTLGIRFEGDAAVVALGPPSGTAMITLRLRWEAELAMTLTDPGYDLRLVDTGDGLMPPRTTLSVDGLKGLRILATREELLCMTLRAADAPRLTIARPISGEVPLSALADTITQLLGSSENLDAKVELSAIGAADQIAEVRWYAEDVDPFDAPRPNAFSVLSSTHGLDAWALALAHPEAGTAVVSAPSSQAAMRAELARVLPPGPWLVFGRRRTGAKIRPRIVPRASGLAARGQTALDRAIGTDASFDRAAAFGHAYERPAQMAPSDRRKIVDLLALARREGLPISSIDALKALDRAPGLATLLLASCDSLEERAALLDLQRDLPFLWSSTTVEDWLGAFSARMNHAEARLAEAGIDDAIAHRSILTALGDIVGLRPELAGHAKAVFLMLIAGRMADANNPDGTATQFMQAGRTDGARRETDRLISRHIDTDSPPQGLLSPQTLLNQQRHWTPYDSSFAEVIAAPFAVADHASGGAVLTDHELRRCRDVWLYDPEFFETAVPIGIDENLRGARGSEVGR